MADQLIFYTHPMSRGRIVRWMLEEIGQPYRTELLDYDTTMKAAAYLAINPMGKVPAIRHGDVVVTEAAAICAYLADVFPAAGLAPPAGDRLRGPYYRWLFFAAGPVEAAWTNKAMGFVVPQGRERMMGYGRFEDVVNALEGAVSQRRISRRRQLYRGRCLCRLRHRFWNAVWHDREAPCLRTVLATAQRPSGGAACEGDR